MMGKMKCKDMIIIHLVIILVIYFCLVQAMNSSLKGKVENREPRGQMLGKQKISSRSNIGLFNSMNMVKGTSQNEYNLIL